MKMFTFKFTYLLIILSFISIEFISPLSASTDPIPGVDVIVEKIPPGHSIGWTRTDSKGIIALNGQFERGYYEVVNRSNTIRAGIIHKGGAIRWQLLKSGNRLKPWMVIDSK